MSLSGDFSVVQCVPFVVFSRAEQVVLAFYNVNANVGSFFAAQSSASVSVAAVAAAQSSLNAVLGLDIVCLIICFVGLFGGYTLMIDKFVALTAYRGERAADNAAGIH